MAGLFTISKGFFFFFSFPQPWGIQIEEGEEKTRRGSILVFWRQEVAPQIQEAAVFVFLFKQADRMDGTSFIKCGFLQSPRVSHLGESHFGKLSVHQIRRRLVQFLSCFTPAFFGKAWEKSPLFSFQGKFHWNSSVWDSQSPFVSFMGSHRLYRTMLMTVLVNSWPQHSDRCVGKRLKTFYSPPPSPTFSLFFFNLKKKCLKRKLRFFSPTFYIRFPHRMPVELHRLKICACHFRHFPPNCKIFKYLSGRLVWNFILMGFMNKSPS